MCFHPGPGRVLLPSACISKPHISLGILKAVLQDVSLQSTLLVLAFGSEEPPGAGTFQRGQVPAAGLPVTPETWGAWGAV